ncbi:Oxidase ustYa like protein [Verticillium longisporum]|nr:Oxidase ustYa like protein [Verticillium longisporum]
MSACLADLGAVEAWEVGIARLGIAFYDKTGCVGEAMSTDCQDSRLLYSGPEPTLFDVFGGPGSIYLGHLVRISCWDGKSLALRPHRHGQVPKLDDILSFSLFQKIRRSLFRVMAPTSSEVRDAQVEPMRHHVGGLRHELRQLLLKLRRSVLPQLDKTSRRPKFLVRPSTDEPQILQPEPIMDSQPLTYQDLSPRDEHDESSSATEVESVLLNEKDREWHDVLLDPPANPRSASSLSARWRRHRWIINTGLILFNVVLSMVLLWKVAGAPSASLRQVGGDIIADRPPNFATKVIKWESDPSFVGGGLIADRPPNFATKVIKWESDPSFVPNNTAEFFEQQTVDKWQSLLPVNAHRGDGETFSTTSMTHQLHCLFMMGRVYAGVTERRTAELPADYHAHFLHCIDYIRQGIMCSGDVALEPHTPEDADDLGAKDGGWNGLHVCKDYGQVLEYLDEQIQEGGRTVLPIDD